MKILLSSVGRRVELVHEFRQALGTSGEVLTTDMDPTAPGLYAAAQGFLVPRADKAEFVPRLLDICREQKVAAVIPLIDPELPILARARPRFADIGTEVLVADPETVDVCFDKLRTAETLSRLGVPIPTAYAAPPQRSPETGKFRVPSYRISKLIPPLVVKPRRGSAGNGVHVCATFEEAEFWLARTEDPMIQECLVGEEITTDVLSDLNGNPLAQVQRMRLKIRGGEVERGITVADKEIAGHVERIASALQAPGVINIQCFKTERGPFFTEINPRFGGGYPLAHAAGAKFPERIIDMLERRLSAECGAMSAESCIPNSPFPIKSGLVMMRYDQAIYKSEEELIRMPDDKFSMSEAHPPREG